MSKKHVNTKTKARDAPVQQRAAVGFVVDNGAGWNGWEELLCSGYKPLTACPEVQTAIGVYADLVANMTIQLLQNTPIGDVRIRDGLSRKLDIEPHRHMTHQTWMSHIVRVMMAHGNQVTVPTYSAEGYLENMEPLPPGSVSFVPDGRGYRVQYNGRQFAPNEVLHFPVNPDENQPWMGTGYTVALRDVVKSLRQTTATKNAIMKSPAPNVIVKIDGLMDQLQTEDGREELRKQYLSSSETGKPWLIPAEGFDVEQVKPLTLNDLAIKTSLELDKRSVAAIMGVPAFLMGVGTFDEKEFNWFVSTRLMSIARIIEQELTRKLLVAPDRYFRFNKLSLLNYNLTEVVNAGKELVDRMAMRRNEWRDWMGLPPDEDMEELLALENYIPATMLGQQKKLETGGENDGNES